MLGTNRLLDYLKKHGVTTVSMCSDGALLNPVEFPLAAVETNGSILFADLPGYSKLASQLDPAECAYVVNHFFA
jgi:class 3 adenylate cyclase